MSQHSVDVLNRQLRSSTVLVHLPAVCEVRGEQDEDADDKGKKKRKDQIGDSRVVGPGEPGSELASIRESESKSTSWSARSLGPAMERRNDTIKSTVFTPAR